MAMLRPDVRDDRGRRRRPLARWPSRPPLAYRLAWRRGLRWEFWAPMPLFSGAGLTLPYWPGPAELSLWLLGPFVLLFVLWLRWSFGLATMRGFRLLGHCAVCDYTLLDLVPESDGCMVCPECGAAWRMEGTAASRLEA